MNEIARGPSQLPTTQAADGIPRLKWTLARFERLIDLGVFGKQDRIELIEGELIPMAAKGNRHERVRGRLAFWISRHVADGLIVYSEPGWRPGGDRYLEPGIIVCPEAFDGNEVPPAEVLLLIEVSDTSLAYDTGLKAETYATLGVREYWVVNARTLETTVHRDPKGSAYGEVTLVAANEVLAATHLPAISLCLDQLGVDRYQP